MIPRCFVDAAVWREPVIVLNPDDSHHLSDVLRVGIGATVVVSDGQGGEATAKITAIAPRGVTVLVTERRVQSGLGPDLILVQAVPKAQKMDWIIQKATEIGICALVPVMTDRGVVKLEDERADHRTARWQRIAVEASKQCRTAWIPRVRPPEALATVLSRPVAEVLLIGSLEPMAVSLKTCMGEMRERRPRSVGLLIGPEGDFSPRELALAREAGALPVSYGSRVLRVETAAIYGLSILAYELSGL